MPSPALVRLTDSTRRLIRTVDGVGEEDFAVPSLLPGWSRSHVVAHLALNAEAMTRGLDGARTGRPAPLYDSREARDADIAELARASGSELRDRLLGSATSFVELLDAVPDAVHRREVEWYPGGMHRPVASFADIRRGEVEVHHADLGVDDYDHTAWPGDFSAWLLDVRSATAEATPAFTAYAGDLDRTWSVAGGGDADPVVTGPADALAWWLSGRGDGAGLACDGPFPRIGAW